MTTSNLTGRYEMITLKYENGRTRDKRTLVVSGPMVEMVAFYEAVKDALEAAENEHTKRIGYTDSDGRNIGWEPSDLMNWRIDPRELEALAKVFRDAEKDGFMRFAAEESRFTYEGDPWSWTAALEAAIKSTEIAVEVPVEV